MARNRTRAGKRGNDTELIIMTVIVSVLVTSIFSQKIGDAFWSGDTSRFLIAGLLMVFYDCIHICPDDLYREVHRMVEDKIA